MANERGPCGTCREYRDNFCRNPQSPYGGKPRISSMGCWAHSPTMTRKQEAARDIALMTENIRDGYMPQQSQAVIDAYKDQIRKQTADDMVDAIYRVMPNADGHEAKSFVAHVLEEFWRD